MNSPWPKHERARVVINYKEGILTTPQSLTHYNESTPFLPGQIEPPGANGPPPPPTHTFSSLDGRLLKFLCTRARAPSCACDACNAYNQRNGIYAPSTFSSYDDIDPKRIGGLTDHQLFLCSPHLVGYILKDRKYGSDTSMNKR